jgi:uncharacterized membrane protein
MTSGACWRLARVLPALLYELLNPIPFGMFVAALVFDTLYFKTAEILWNKSAAWLITVGLLFAILPRLINLVYVWASIGRRFSFGDKCEFWLSGFGIVAAILNAFIHSRDAYAVMPSGLYLSVLTVALFGLGRLVIPPHLTTQREARNA